MASSSNRSNDEEEYRHQMFLSTQGFIVTMSPSADVFPLQRENTMESLRSINSHPINEAATIDSLTLFDEQREINNLSSSVRQRTESPSKRKRHGSQKNDANVSRSMSQLSVSQRASKKTKVFTSTKTSNNDDDDDEDSDAMTYNIKKYSFSILRTSDHCFRQALSNVSTDAKHLRECLDTKEKMLLVRQVVECTSDYYYYDLQRQLWQEYHDVSMKDNVWGKKMSKCKAKLHGTCRSYGFTKAFIEQRQSNIGKQLEKVGTKLKQYLHQLQSDSKQWQPSIDFLILSESIDQLVIGGQRKLRQECDFKKAILHMNANDHRLIKEFYDLVFTNEQQVLARNIWQTMANLFKVKEQQEILQKRIYLRRLPSDCDQLIDGSLVGIKPILMNHLINNDQRACLASKYSKLITQYKFDLMALNLQSIEQIIHGYEQTLKGLQAKLRDTCYPSFIQAVQKRQSVMQERHSIYLKHKLETFFDEAPTTENE